MTGAAEDVVVVEGVEGVDAALVVELKLRQSIRVELANPVATGQGIPCAIDATRQGTMLMPAPQGISKGY
jgi:hypothetical protein